MVMNSGGCEETLGFCYVLQDIVRGEEFATVSPSSSPTYQGVGGLITEPMSEASTNVSVGRMTRLRAVTYQGPPSSFRTGLTVKIDRRHFAHPAHYSGRGDLEEDFQLVTLRRRPYHV